MTSVAKTVLSLGILCLALVFGLSFVSAARAQRHYHRLMYAAHNNMPEQVVDEYHHLPRKLRLIVQSHYDEACKIIDDSARLSDLFPTMETADVVSFAVFALGMVAFWLWLVPRTQKQAAQKKAVVMPDAPTKWQIEFIRRFNNGIIPVGLTKTAATTMINNHFSRISAMSKRRNIDISPSEFMTGSRSYREKMKLERERKRAQEKLERQREQERRQREREAQKAQKAIDRLYEKRAAEEEKLIKAREDSFAGVVRKARNAKALAIQELQNLVNDILADKKIEPQEVRQLKAWLMANKQSSDDFSSMLRIIDESLVDGVIDAEETQAIYEGVIDCLITLRERRTS